MHVNFDTCDGKATGSSVQVPIYITRGIILNKFGAVDAEGGSTDVYSSSLPGDKQQRVVGNQLSVP